jgi:hypothetical protein
VERELSRLDQLLFVLAYVTQVLLSLNRSHSAQKTCQIWGTNVRELVNRLRVGVRPVLRFF